MRSGRFYDSRLTPQENKAAEMAFNGFPLDEIADELDVSRAHASVCLSVARSKGVDVWAKHSARKGWANGQLLSMRNKGLSIQQICERTGISPGAVSVRLCRAKRQAGLPMRTVYRTGWPEETALEWERLAAAGVSASKIAAKYATTRDAVLGLLWRRRQKQMERAA